jgi:hypothetical protein
MRPLFASFFLLLAAAFAFGQTDRGTGQPLFTVDPNCHCYDPNKTFILNKDAWADPDPGKFGTSPAYYSDYRRHRHPIENMNLGRTFRIGEGKTFNLRIEFTNVFNRAYWDDPSLAAVANAKLQQSFQSNGNTAAGFGRLTTTGFTGTQNFYPRQGVLVGRFTF